ncbi:MAG: sigma-70 family RNA polymerase sigma factor [Bacteroidota bacterium]
MMDSDNISVSVRQYAESVQNSGDQMAFNALFDLLWEPMYGYAASILQYNALAQDLVQEIWLDYWNRRKHVDPTNIKAYLFKAVRFRCYRHLRDTKFNKLQLQAAMSLLSKNEIEEEESAVELMNQVNAILATLPSRCQEVFRLSRINDFSNTDIAQILSISQRTVENQISTVLRKLRKELSVARMHTFL